MDRKGSGAGRSERGAFRATAESLGGTTDPALTAEAAARRSVPYSVTLGRTLVWKSSIVFISFACGMKPL
jgi:hypothetical protein